MNNISGSGLQVQILASVTFPNGGFTVTQFADDGDPLDIQHMQIQETAMGLNGDMTYWKKLSPILITLNVVPNSDNDNNMDILLLKNLASRGKQSVTDEITMVVTYPDHRIRRFKNGVITNGTPGNSVTSSGRMRSKPYTFAFETEE